MSVELFLERYCMHIEFSFAVLYCCLAVKCRTSYQVRTQMEEK